MVTGFGAEEFLGWASFLRVSTFPHPEDLLRYHRLYVYGLLSAQHFGNSWLEHFLCVSLFQVIGKIYRCPLDKLQQFEGREPFFCKKNLFFFKKRIFF